MSQACTLDDFVPVTFVDRGICIPFTTPGLEFARIRLTNAGGMEVLVRNLSGGRGIYILSWEGVQEVFPVTVYDHLLMDELTDLSPFDPYKIRQVIQRVVADGSAGIAAAESARRAEEAEHQQVLLTQMQFIAQLIREYGIPNMGLAEIASGDIQVKTQIRGTLREIAKQIGDNPDNIFSQTEIIGELFHPIGLPNSPIIGRLRQLLTRIIDTRTQIDAWAQSGPSDIQDVIRFVIRSIDVTMTASRAVLEQLDQECATAIHLLKALNQQPQRLRERSLRCAWLLDGWDYIIAIWSDAIAAGDHARRAALIEMSTLIPALPREAMDWTGLQVNVDPDQGRIQKLFVKANEDWRGRASIVDLIERNEKRKAEVT